MRLLHLYRPLVPDLRAQSIQVLHTCHALARRGHQISLFAQVEKGFEREAAAALRPYGLDPIPGLDLRLLPWQHKGLAGLDFRLRALRWCAAAVKADGGRPPVVYARTKRHAAQAAMLRGLCRAAVRPAAKGPVLHTAAFCAYI